VGDDLAARIEHQRPAGMRALVDRQVKRLARTRSVSHGPFFFRRRARQRWRSRNARPAASA
jgi:hypothetical protein